MENKLLKVSLKFGLLLGGIALLLGLINSFTFNPDNVSQLTYLLSGALTYVLLFIFIPMAHYEFNKKNGHFISFKDAILIGLIIIGISYVITTSVTIFSFEFLMKEKLEALSLSQSRKYGVDMSSHYSTGQIISSTIFSLLIEVLFLFIIIMFEAQWKIYRKAGREGLASIIPIYNVIVLLEIVKRPTWWIILLLIPFVNIIYSIIVINSLAKRFNKDEGFTIGLIFLPFIFYPLLGLSDEKYIDED